MESYEQPRTDELELAVGEFHSTFTAIETELGRVIVGMRDVVRLTVAGIITGGHVLLEGVPGLGKTLLVKSVARTLGLNFKRIQFTPDLMPSDITGTQMLSEDDSGRRRFIFKPGPVFANIVLADEINRATPKTQSALLEAMEERQISVLDETYPLPRPFFVLATQNPVELEGTYPLPEAQLDRFLMKLLVASPTAVELKEVLQRTTGVRVHEAEQVLPADEVIRRIDRMKTLVRRVVVPDHLQDVIVRIMEALTPTSQFATPLVKEYVRFGPGPRGAQSLVLVAKVLAILGKRVNASFDDIRTGLSPTLRHRLILNYQADADGITSDDIIEEVKRAK